MEILRLQEELRVVEEKQLTEHDGPLFAMQKAHAFLKEQHAAMKESSVAMEVKVEQQQAIQVCISEGFIT